MVKEVGTVAMVMWESHDSGVRYWEAPEGNGEEEAVYKLTILSFITMSYEVHVIRYAKFHQRSGGEDH